MIQKNFFSALVLCIMFTFNFAFALMFEGRVYEGHVGDESTPIPNVTVKLYGSQDINYLGTELISTTTDAKGWYGLEIRPGYEVYNIVEIDPSGYSSVGATSVDGNVINANQIQYTLHIPLEDQTLTGNKFWDDKPDDAGIGDFVWEDINSNGLQDSGEPPMSGVKVELLDSNQNSIATTTTNSSGQYKFTGLAAGNYYIRFDEPSGYYFTNPNIGTDETIDSDAYPGTGETDIITLSTDEFDKDIDAGLIEGEEEEKDFGDAPDPKYPTYLKNNGARHTIDRNVYLGTRVDSEADGLPNSDATGDDASGYDDEDGIVFQNDLVLGNFTSFIAEASVKGWLGVWIDFNGNGSWADPGESMFNSDTMVFAGANHWGFSVPANAKVGKTAARFRFSTKHSQTYDGDWPDGEVEDYWVEIKEESEGGNIHIYKDAQPKDGTSFPFTGDLGAFTLFKPPLDSIVTFAGTKPWTYKIEELVPAGWNLQDIVVNDPTGNSSVDVPSATAKLVLDGTEDIWVRFVNRKEGEENLDFGDASDPSYPTLLVNDGARHIIDRSVFLGSSVDADPDGQPDGGASGDDNDGNDDEDGVVFQNDLIPGAWTSYVATASVKGALGVWVDFNGDGDWLDPEESIFNHDTTVFAGANAWSFKVPQNAKPGKTTARFRYSTKGGQNFDGEWPNGEVEDYLVEIKKESDGGKITIIKKAIPADNTLFPFTSDFGPFDLKYPADSSITFSGVQPGTYNFQETAPAGWPTISIHAQDPNGGTVVDAVTASAKVVIDANEHVIVTFINYKEDEKPLDFGDAPDPTYPTLLVNNGARHIIDPKFYLGSGIDPEADGLPSPIADGDDNDNSNDEDGVSMSPFIAPGQAVPINVIASTSGALNAWLDFNGDGDWQDAGEHIIAAQSVNAGGNSFTINVPTTAKPGLTFVRFRFSSQRQLSCDGLAPDGEIEDYPVEIKEQEKGSLIIVKDANPKDDTPFWFCAKLTGFFNIYCFPLFDPSGNQITLLNPSDVQEVSESTIPGWVLTNITIAGDTDNGSIIDLPNGNVKIDFDPGENIIITFFNEQTGDEFDFGDAPDSHNNPGYPTIHANGGAYHSVNPSFFLGSAVDPEPDGQPEPHAMGDDNDGTDDEDGVHFPTPMNIGQNVMIKVEASQKGILNAWIDFDHNKSWADAGEHVLVDQTLNPGSNNLTFTIPVSAAPGPTFARFRLSGHTGLSFTGYGRDGEVEDYEIVIDSGDRPPLKWSQPPLKSRDPDFPFPHLFWGWDEVSILDHIVIADDWFCRDPRPVTGVRWWGSYVDWAGPKPPEHAPMAFHLGIWSDVPKSDELDWSHPGELIWEYGVERFATNEKVVGGDFMPGHMEKPDSCFEYYLELPKEHWFYQEKDSTVYWLSIAAIYEKPPEIHHWGWKTRELYFNDLGVRIFEPKELMPGTHFKEGEPIGDNWDMSFELSTIEYELEFDFGDAPEPMYQSLFETNGAHHFIDPRVRLGEEIDRDENGQPEPQAMGDDNDGTNDDDGVELLTDLVPSRIAKIKVNASIHGFLNTWIDYNQDNNWDDMGEHVLINVELEAGDNILDTIVPDKAKLGATFVRFRFSTVPGLGFRGLAFDGEVEDYVVEIKELNDVSVEVSIPDNFALYQNYPNPFNPTTEIRFDLPHAVHTQLVIYDLRGRLVRTLFDGTKQAGHHSILWDGQDDNGEMLPSGIYIYSLTAEQFNQSCKMAFVK